MQTDAAALARRIAAGQKVARAKAHELAARHLARLGTVTAGVVAQQLGISREAVQVAITDGLVQPAHPAPKQGSPARWTAADIETLRTARAVRRAAEETVRAAATAPERLRRARPGTLLVHGPRGERIVRGAATVGELARAVGSPFVVVAGRPA